MREIQKSCGESDFWGAIEKVGEGKAYAISYIKVGAKEETLRFPRNSEYNALSVKLKYQMTGRNDIERLVIPKEMREFVVSDYFFPRLTSIEVEEGAPFYAKGVNLFSREGKLLNFFRPDRYELMEESLIPLDPKEDLEIKGDCLMALLAPTDTLVLPAGLRRVSKKAFYRHAPRRLVCSRLLASTELQPDTFRGEDVPHVKYVTHVESIKELVLTDPKAPLSIELLFCYTGLESISLPKGHRKYETRDGMLYKDHGTTLVFVPPFHPQVRQGVFSIPWGVRRLGGRLFEGWKDLKRVEMPDTVWKLEGGVFANCEKLEYVRLSDSIIRIPGRPRDQRWSLRSVDPTFLWCLSLTQVHFPKNLVCLGKGAFKRTKLTRVELPEGTEEVGEDCFFECEKLTEVYLPKSLKRVGERAFPGYHEISLWAYEGTAKGLLSSLSFHRDNDMAWLHVLDDKGANRFTFPVPHSHSNSNKLERELRQAWDGEKLCLDALLQCMPHMSKENREGMVLMALCHMDKKAFAPYDKFRKRKLTDYGIELIKGDKLEDFSRYLALSKPHSGMRKVLLDYCNKTGRNQFIPLLLEEDHKLTKGRGRASLEKGKFDL